MQTLSRQQIMSYAGYMYISFKALFSDVLSIAIDNNKTQNNTYKGNLGTTGHDQAQQQLFRPLFATPAKTAKKAIYIYGN